jgi:hypothetical protein
MATSYILLAALLALVSWQAMASDPSPLQDFCVADKYSPGIHIYLHTLFLSSTIEQHFIGHLPDVLIEFSCICFVS